MDHYGLLLRKLREEAGLSQTECAKKMNKPQTTLSNIERNHAPQIDDIINYIQCVKPDLPLYKFFMKDTDVVENMGLDQEWLNIGKSIQSWPDHIKDLFYQQVHIAMKVVVELAANGQLSWLQPK